MDPSGRPGHPAASASALNALVAGWRRVPDHESLNGWDDVDEGVERRCRMRSIIKVKAFVTLQISETAQPVGEERR